MSKKLLKTTVLTALYSSDEMKKLLTFWDNMQLSVVLSGNTGSWGKNGLRTKLITLRKGCNKTTNIKAVASLAINHYSEIKEIQLTFSNMQGFGRQDSSLS